MMIIPSWAIGTAFIVVVVAIAQIVARRLTGRAGRGWRLDASEPDLSRLTQALDDVTRRLGEVEERMDFAERLLAKERIEERLAPPHT